MTSNKYGLCKRGFLTIETIRDITWRRTVPHEAEVISFNPPFPLPLGAKIIIIIFLKKGFFAIEICGRVYVWVSWVGAVHWRF